MRSVLRCCCSSSSKLSRQPPNVPVRRISSLASSTSLTSSSLVLPMVPSVVHKKSKAIRRPCSVHHRMLLSTTSYTDEHAIAFTNNDNEFDDDHKKDLLNLDQQLKEMFGDNHRRHYQNVWTASSSSSVVTSTSPAMGTEEVSSSLSTNTLLPVDSDKRLDRQSRFLLQLLQTLYAVGLTKTSDQVTTERCNAIVSRLAAGPSGDTPSTPATTSNNIKSTNNNSMIDVDHWQRTERARSILECMEIYLPFDEQKNYNTPGGIQIPIELPIPTHETYLTILKMYASGKQHKQTNCGIVNSSQGAAVLEIKMEHLANEAPLVATQIVERMEASGNLALRPTSLHWNQVLSCYANAIHRPNRSLEAATLLYQLQKNQHQNHNDTTTNNNNNGNTTALPSSSSSDSSTRSLTDGSSFSHTLRCCVDPSVLEEYENYHHHHNNHNNHSTPHTFSTTTTTTTITNKKEQEEKYANLAIGVAQRVWKGLQQQQQQQQTVSSSSSSSSSNNSSTTHTSLSQQQDRVEDHLTGLLNEESDYSDRDSEETHTVSIPSSKKKKKEEEETEETKNTSTHSNNDNNTTIRPLIDMTSFHFVHMLRVGRNFATLLRVVEEAEQQQQHEAEENTNNDQHDQRRSTLQDLRDRHEEWIRTIVQECMQHSKVNVFILQEMMYQGKILVGCSNGGSSGGSGSADSDSDKDNNKNDTDKYNNEEYLKWIQRVLLPSTVSTNGNIMNTRSKSSSSSSSNARQESLSRKWETEMVPALIEASKKATARANNKNKNTSKSATYATVIQQTKILIKYLPSHWRAKAE